MQQPRQGKPLAKRHTREGLIIGDIGPLLMAPLLDVERLHRFIILAVCNVTASVLQILFDEFHGHPVLRPTVQLLVHGFHLVIGEMYGGEANRR